MTPKQEEFLLHVFQAELAAREENKRHRQDASGHCHWRESLPDGPEDEILLRDRAGLEAGRGPQAGHARETGEEPAETGPPDPR